MDDTENEEQAADGARARGTTRRQALISTASALVGGAAGWGIRGALPPASADTSAPSPTSSPLAAAELRDGITWPTVPQRHTQVVAVRLTGAESPEVLAAARRARAVAPRLPDDSGTTTVLAGLSLPHARNLYPERTAKAQELPSFANDADDVAVGGDLVVQLCAETAAGVDELLADVQAALGEHTVLWSEKGYRDAPSPRATTRATMGFIDGIMNPRTARMLRDGVWSAPHHRDTYGIFRRMRIAPAFTAEPLKQQENAIGRKRATGVPLSGGSTMDQVDLFAKTPDGHFRTPEFAHTRRAHPANIGRALMLRRSYSFEPPEGTGLIFIAFVSDPETFIMTQRRLDEGDGLISKTSTTASGCFFIPEELSSTIGAQSSKPKRNTP